MEVPSVGSAGLSSSATAVPARHLRKASGRSEGSTAGSGRKSPRPPAERPPPTPPPPPHISAVVLALIATKKQLGLPDIAASADVLAASLKAIQRGDGPKRKDIDESADSDFLVADYAMVRGILGETWLHRGVKEGKWDVVRRWLKKGRAKAALEAQSLAVPVPAAGADDDEVDEEASEVLGPVSASGEQGSGELGPAPAQAPGSPTEIKAPIARPSASSKVNDWLKESSGINARTIVGTTPLHEACSTIPHFSTPDGSPISVLAAGVPLTSPANSGLTVSDLLEAGADPLLRDLFGLTPLHRACIAGNGAVITVLLTKTPRAVAKQQLAITDNHGNTPLHVAAYHDHADAVRLLLESGAEADARDEDGGTALHDACEGGAESAVRVLLEHGRAVEVGPDGVRRRKLDVNARDFKNRTALHVATTPEVAKLLLADGAKLHAVDVDGFTPLHRAAARGLVRLIDFFIAIPGIKVDQRTKPHRRTSLHLACAHGSGFFKIGDLSVPAIREQNGARKIVVDYPAVIESLVRAGAKVDAHTHPHRNTPVHVCCSFRPSPPLDRDLEKELREWLEVLRLLLRAGQPADAPPGAPNRHLGFRNCFGDTPLHCAIVPEVAELLLAHGADTDVQNWNGETPVDTARRAGRTRVVQVLEAHAARAREEAAAVPVPAEPQPEPAASSPIRPKTALPARPAEDLARKSSLSGGPKVVPSGLEAAPKKVNFADGAVAAEAKEETAGEPPRSNEAAGAQ
ncbi:ankyrin repeat-containing domain protein [Hyaloraphidium curvatum]|nr:ankyrin repeat-containing domain protein [Hyaloraphidium curvatum]